MKLVLTLTQREAEAVMRAELSVGYGVRRSQALRSAEMKIRHAIVTAEGSADRGSEEGGER